MSGLGDQVEKNRHSRRFCATTQKKINELREALILSNRIVVLSAEIANKIAAGEVVERPASIVKELVENSIDARADDIRVELEGGGCQTIKVMDNGFGIASDDVMLVFERHATSKIQAFEDIFNVVSFGFRGEAMPSIAAVARVELLTRNHKDLSGTKVIVEGGQIKDVSPIGCPRGTQVTVTRIFAHVPARRKFLKTEATEQAACLDVITRAALAHPEIRFKVWANGREVFAAPEVKDITQRIASVMGRDFVDHCLAVENQKDRLFLSGFISRPEFTKSNSKNIYLFVNKRFVRDPSITHAVLTAYKQVIEPRRYPAAVLFLELPPGDVDVNVHPAKLEVRFRDSRSVYDIVSQTIAQGLAGARVSEGSLLYRLQPRQQDFRPYDFRKKDLPANEKPNLFYGKNMQQAVTDDLLKGSAVSEKMSVYDPTVFQSKESVTFSHLRYIGQFANSYLVLEGNKVLILLDQHAAHERIMLEKLKREAGRHEAIQTLLLPEIVHLTPAEYAVFEASMDWIREMGLDVEGFGVDTIVVRSIPAMLSHLSVKEMISDVVQQLKEENQTSSLAGKKDKIMMAWACRAAIKANCVLSPDEALTLCRELDETPFPLTCPHGRPVIISFSLTEVERLFKRK
jgi:DNA mismatch repair protein MutL